MIRWRQRHQIAVDLVLAGFVVSAVVVGQTALRARTDRTRRIDSGSPTATRGPADRTAARGTAYTLEAVSTDVAWRVDQSRDCARPSVVQRTADGGHTWQVVRLGQPVRLGLSAVATVRFATSRLGFATGYEPDCRTAVWRTADGGMTWERVTPTVALLTELDLADPTDGFGLLLDTALVRAGNSAASYTELPKPCPGATTALSAASAREAVLVCASPQLVFGTVDGGRTWRRLPGTGLDGRVSGLHLVDPSVGYAVLTETRCPDGALRVTTDGGRTWGRLPCPASVGAPGRVLAVSFTTARSGWLLTVLDGRLRTYRTVDDGLTWAPP